MRTQARLLAAVFTMGFLIAANAAAASAGSPDRYLHVRVQDSTEGESVNVNIPLAMAEKIVPAIHNDKLHDGRITVDQDKMKEVDIQAVLQAIHSAPDNEFVTIQQKDQNIRVLKSNGNIIVKIRDASGKDDEKVDVTVPLAVADALFSSIHDNQLDIAAALRALNQAGQTLIVTVESATQHVRVWVDERNTQ